MYLERLEFVLFNKRATLYNASMSNLDGTKNTEYAEMDTEVGYFSFEGSGQFVLEQTKLIVNLLEKVSHTPTTEVSAVDPLSKIAVPHSDGELLSETQSDTLREFLATIGVTSHQERYAAILSWLEGNKNMYEISAQELESIYKQLRIPFPQHPSQIFWDAKSRKGWFVSAPEEGYYQLSDKARQAVEQKMTVTSNLSN